MKNMILNKNWYYVNNSTARFSVWKIGTKNETQEEVNKRRDYFEANALATFPTEAEAIAFAKPLIKQFKAEKLAKDPRVIAMLNVVESKILKLFMLMSLKNEYKYEVIDAKGVSTFLTETIPAVDADKISIYVETVVKQQLVGFNKMVDSVLNDDERSSDINKTLLASELSKENQPNLLGTEATDGKRLFLKIVQKVVGRKELRNYVKLVRLMGLDTTLMHDEPELN